MSDSKSLHIYEEIMLLAFRDKEGTLEISHYEYVLAGALLADLLLSQTIKIDDTKQKHILLETDGFVENAVLDECIEMVRQSKKPQSLKNWVSLFAHIKHLKEKVAQQLVERGILEADKTKFLKLIPMKVYPEVDPEPEKEIIERLHTAIFTDVEDVDARTSALISLASGTKLLRYTFGRKEINSRKDRIQNIANGDLTSKATQEVIQTIRAMVAISAAITSTIAISSASSGS